MVAARTLVILMFSMLGLIVIPSYLHTASEQRYWYPDLLSSGVLMAARLWLESPPLQQTSFVAGTDVQVSFNTLPQNEPSVAVSPSDPRDIAVGANDYDLGFAWLGLYNSSDGGLSWTRAVIPRTGILSGYALGSDPSVVFDRNGNLYYGGIVFNVRPNGQPVDGSIFVSRFSDGGSSFSGTTLVATGSRTVFNDKPYIVADNSGGPFDGRIYVSWTKLNFQGNDVTLEIMVSHSADRGATFSTPVKISTSPDNQGSLPVVGPDGEVYVVWSDRSSRQIMVAKSDDGGASFSSPVPISSYAPLPESFPNSHFRVNNFPAAAVDSYNGNVYVAWADYGNRNADVLASRSIDGGWTWSAPVSVNDDGANHDQFFPWMSMSSGLLSIVFYDRRLDPGNHLMDVFYSASADGLTFSPNVKVTDVRSNPDAILFGNQSFIGDYIGIASNGTFAYPAWTDMRNVTPSSSVNQDIFTDRLVLGRPPALDPITDQIVDEGSELSFTVRASDEVGENLTLTVEGPPFATGASFSSEPSTSGTVTGTFSWTPGEEEGPDTYWVQITASDGFLPQKSNVTITVEEVNRPPVLYVPQAQTINEESLLTFQVSALDPDRPFSNMVTLSCENCDTLGAAFDTETGNFTWTPNEGQGPGDYTLLFTATDDGLPPHAETAQVTVHVRELNLPPDLSALEPLTVDEETTLTFQVTGSDPDVLGQDVQALTFSPGPDAPDGATITAEGVFSWTPSEKQGPAEYQFSVIVSDSLVEASGTVTIVVNEVNRPPLLTVPGAFTVDEGFLLIFFVDAEDPDLDTEGQPLNSITISVSDPPEGAVFETDTRAFYWTPSDNQGPGVYTLVFTAVENDGSHLSETATVVVTVVEPGRPSGPLSELGGLTVVFWGSLGLVVVALLAALVKVSRRGRGH